PGRQCRVPPVIRASRERRGTRVRRTRQRTGLLPDAVVRRAPDYSPTLVGEQPPVLGGAERVEVLPEDGDELWRDRHEPDLFRRSVLEAPVVMSLTGVCPLLSNAGTRPVEQHRPPAGLGQFQVRIGE